MLRTRLLPLSALLVIQVGLSCALLPISIAQEWAVRKPSGTLMVADFRMPSTSVVQNYGEGLITADKDNNYVPCLAEDYRWVDTRTIEFKLRRGVTFHNGEKFNADAVRINWEQYKLMESPRPHQITMLPDETSFEILDDYTVRFVFPDPDGLAFLKFMFFFQIAPDFFSKHQMPEKNWGYLPIAGPWGTGPFRLTKGTSLYARPSDKQVLEAYQGYWDRRYPKVERVIFNNTLRSDRNEAMRLCRENEGAVDIVN
jgi:peptide/nickel transport system substrate-binding protein